MQHISGPGLFAVEVVGESHYQAWLERLCGGRSEESAEVYVRANLVFDDKNPYDRTAVRIDIQFGTVGHLSREDAKRFRWAMRTWGVRDRSVSCDAVIVGGWERRNGQRGHFGIKLDLPPFETLAHRDDEPAQPARRGRRRGPSNDTPSVIGIGGAVLLLTLLGLCVWCGSGGDRKVPQEEPPQQQPAAQRLQQPKPKWRNVPRKLVVGAEAKLASTNGEGFVRLIRTKELHKQWHTAIAEKNERKQLDVATAGGIPIVPVDDGARVKVLLLKPEVASVEVIDGRKAGEVGYCRPDELDPGADRIPVE